jgi:predicted regulator of Ras-like GTPase activity (Roadblock/LC7/MglB family)
MSRLLGLVALGRREPKAAPEPPRAPSFAELAESYRRKDLLEEATAVCEQGLHDWPSYVSGYIVMARIHRDAGALESAEVSARKALELDPMNAIALTLMGDLAIRRKRWEEAVRYLEDALFLSPTDPHASELLGLARQRISPPVMGLPAAVTVEPAPQAPRAPEPKPTPAAPERKPAVASDPEREVTLLRQEPGIEGVLLLSSDGLPVSGSLGSGNETDEEIAALAAGFMAEWAGCTQLPPPRPQGLALMEGEYGQLVVAAAGAWILLVAVSGHIRPGRVLGNIRTAVERIGG